MINILHLYHDLMNLYGEYGNVKVLKRHLEDLGQRVGVDHLSIGEQIDFGKYDFIYCGCGTERHKDLALEDFRRYRVEFQTYLERGKLALFTGNAAELPADLGLVEMKYERTDTRYVGDVIANNEQFGEVVGFINRCSKPEFAEENALFELELLFSDGKKYPLGKEGYRYKNLFATYLIGPLLSKNPLITAYFTKLLVGAEDYRAIVYPLEQESHEVTLKALRELK